MGWYFVVEKIELIGDGLVDQFDKFECVLILKVEGVLIIIEILLKWQFEKCCYVYCIEKVDVVVLLVMNYVLMLCVKDEGGKVMVSWKVGFYCGFFNNNLSFDQNDEVVMKVVIGIYQVGLDVLVERFGKVE